MEARSPVLFSHVRGPQRKSIVKVRDEAPLELLSPLGCGIQTGAGTVLRALRVGAGASFAVTGAGAVGLSAVMVANVAGANAFMQSCKTLMGFVEGDGVPDVVNPQLIDVHL